MAMQSTALRLATVLLLVLSLSLTEAYRFAPVLSVFAAKEGTGSYKAAVTACGERGGYLGAEPTTAMRATHASVGWALAGTNWYSFLGANVEAPLNITPVCKASYTDNPSDTASAGDCIYRWKMGRYLDFSDDTTFIGSKWYYRSGISFYRGTLVSLTTSDCTYTVNGTITLACGPISGFPSYFMTAANAPTGTDTSDYIANRPGFDNGHYVVLVGTSATATVWSDNEPLGGYTYAGATKSTTSTSATSGVLSTTSAAATVSSFIVVCDAQAPSRIMLEPYADPKSNSNLVWWVIFLVILFVVCGVAFVVVSCCQEREDMDEPPEDAPEWAEEEASQVMKPKRYVSQNSFRSHSEDYEREDSYSDADSRSGSEMSSKGGDDDDCNEREVRSGSRTSSRSGTFDESESENRGVSFREGR